MLASLLPLAASQIKQKDSGIDANTRRFADIEQSSKKQLLLSKGDIFCCLSSFVFAAKTQIHLHTQLKYLLRFCDP